MRTRFRTLFYIFNKDKSSRSVLSPHFTIFIILFADCINCLLFFNKFYSKPQFRKV